jgi:hypothetical protein
VLQSCGTADAPLPAGGIGDTGLAESTSASLMRVAGVGCSMAPIGYRRGYMHGVGIPFGAASNLAGWCVGPLTSPPSFERHLACFAGSCFRLRGARRRAVLAASKRLQSIGFLKHSRTVRQSAQGCGSTRHTKAGGSAEHTVMQPGESSLMDEISLCCGCSQPSWTVHR